MIESKESEHLAPEQLTPMERFQRGWEDIISLHDRIDRMNTEEIRKQDESLAEGLKTAILDMESALPTAGLDPKVYYPLLHYFTCSITDRLRINRKGKAFKEMVTQNVRVEQKQVELEREICLPTRLQERFNSQFSLINRATHAIMSGFGADVKPELDSFDVYYAFKNVESLGLALGMPPKDLYRILAYHASKIASFAGKPHKSLGPSADFQTLAERFKELSKEVQVSL